MGTFEQIQRKSNTNSTRAAPTSHRLRPSRSFALPAVPTSEQVSPDQQTQPTYDSRLRYSLTYIPILPPSSQDTSEPVVDQGPQVRNQLQTRIQAARSGGHPLEKQAQQRLEQGLGTDLSGVRIHTDSEADRLSRSVDAMAFTTGADIFFSAGTYRPSTPEGLRLLAHETTHVLQQTEGSVTSPPREEGVSISDPSDYSEKAAEQNAAHITTNPLVSPEGTVAQDRLSLSSHAEPFTTISGLRPFMATRQVSGTRVIQRRKQTFTNTTNKKQESYEIPDNVLGVPFSFPYYYHFIEKSAGSSSLFQAIQKATGLATFHITVDHTTGGNRQNNGFHVKVVGPGGQAYLFYDLTLGTPKFSRGQAPNLQNFQEPNLILKAMDFVAAEFINKTKYGSQKGTGGPKVQYGDVKQLLPAQQQQELEAAAKAAKAQKAGPGKTGAGPEKTAEELNELTGTLQKEAAEKGGFGVSLEDYLKQRTQPAATPTGSPLPTVPGSSPQVGPALPPTALEGNAPGTYAPQRGSKEKKKGPYERT